jgi:hypothetical protein
MVRLGTHQRSLLIEARNGPTRICADTMSVAEQRRRYRAAHALAKRGLAIVTSKYCSTTAGAWRAMRHLELTDLAFDRIGAGRRKARRAWAAAGVAYDGAAALA